MLVVVLAGGIPADSHRRPLKTFETVPLKHLALMLFFKMFDILLEFLLPARMVKPHPFLTRTVPFIVATERVEFLLRSLVPPPVILLKSFVQFADLYQCFVTHPFFLI